MRSIGLITIIYLVVLLELLFKDDFIVIRYLHFGYVAFYLISIGLFVYLGFIRSKKALWLLPALFFISIQYLSPFTTTKHPTANGVNQNTINLLSFSINSRNKNYQQVVKLLRQHPADIVCLQEIPFSRYQRFIQLLKETGLGYKHVYAKQRSLMILSRHNIIPNKTMPFLQATIEINDKTLKVWNIHSPKSLTNKNHQGFYFDKLKQDIKTDTSNHQILCGDFNSTPHNNILPQFLDNFQPAYLYTTNSIGFTYPTPKAILPSPIPLLKIDYLLLSKNFEIDHYERLAQYANSDHYPIFAVARFQD